MTLSRRDMLARAGGALIASAAPASTRVSRRDFRVLTSDGLHIHVRELDPTRDSGRRARGIILLHGARVPGLASFDLAVPGGSFAEDLALRVGRPVYVMDARNYGASDRVAAMAQPPLTHRPQSRAYEVVRDIDAAVREVARLTALPAVSLIGWATGGAWASYYASLWPERVEQLVTLNTLYGASTSHSLLGPASDTADPAHPDRLNPAIGAYALYTGATLLPGWDRSIPEVDKTQWRDPAVAAAYVAAALASDPQSASHQPPAFRAPMGAIEDSFYQAVGRRIFDASSMTSDTLVVRSERDFWSRPEDASAFIHDAVRTSSIRLLSLPEATHFVHLDRPERGRDRLLRELEVFLRVRSSPS
jgi:pimeloyl-ACP methyl ester carboxylesterase